EEWVLRWLLKKLKGPAQERNEYRKTDRSWILLRILFGRIPIKSLAFTLNENNFLAILQDTLVALESAGNEENHLSDGTYDSKAGALLKRVPEADSSTRSRKRKRTDGPKVGTAATDSSSVSYSDTFLAILESIHALVKLADQVPQAQSSLKAQLKLVFRGELKASAIILGKSCSHAETAIDKFDAAKADFFKQRIYTSLVSVLDIWALRSDSSDNNSSKSSNDLFVSHALVSVLGLIKKIHQSLDDIQGNQGLANGLERLVALHVVLHLREAFFSESVTTNSQISLKKVQLLSNEVESRLGAVLTDTNTTILPTLFDVSIRAMPRNNFRRQLHETPWLESLALSLLARAGYPLGGDRAAESASGSVLLLQEFLNVAIHRKLKLSLETLVQITSRYSRLSQNKDEIEWHLIAQILQLDVDVFLLNSGLEQSATLLESLLGGMESLFFQPKAASSDLYHSIKLDIVIPLARGFFNARDGSAFIRIWTEQLTRLETVRHTGEDNVLFSIWEDDDVAKACGERLAAPDTQLDAQVEDSLAKIQSTKLSLSELLSAYPHLVVLDAILMSPSKGGLDAISNDRYEQILKKLSALLSSGLQGAWRWRVWRLLQNSVYRYPACSESIQFDIKGSLVPVALHKLELFSKHPKPTLAQDCLETFWCLNLVVCLGNKSAGDTFSEHLNRAVHAILPHLKLLLKSGVSVWDGRMETLITPAAVIMGCLATLLANNQAIAQLGPETRQLLFTNLLSCLGNESTSLMKSQLADIWSDFLSPRSVTNSAFVVDDLVKVVYDKLEKDAVPSKLLVGTLLYIPTRLISRGQRGSILDLLQSSFLDGKVGLEIKLDVLLLMTRLVEAARSPAQITSDEDILWAISRSINVSNQDNCQLLFDAFQKFHEVIVDRFEATPEDSVTKFMKNTYSKVTKETASPNYQTMEYPLFVHSLLLLHKREQQLGSKKKFEAICDLRKKTFDALISDLHSVTKTIKKASKDLDTVKLTGIMCMLDTFQDLQHESKDSRKEIRKLEEYMTKYDLPVQFKKQAKLRSMSSKAPSTDIESRLLGCTTLFPLEQLHGKDQRTLVHQVKHQLSGMKEETVVELIHNICEDDLSGEQSGYQLLLLGMAILNLDPIQDRESLASGQLSTAFTKVSVAFSHSSSIEAFCLAAEFLDTFLRSQSRSVTQWNIDNLLANISLIASPVGPPFDAKYAGAIHARLCKLLGTVLGLYRQKLSGRFHLVLPIMQALLRCLFTRNQKTASSTGTGPSLPPWVESPVSLEAEHGTQFSRLLSALCDPTVSSVQRQRGGDHSSQGLRDNTKKVKSLAGQYLQYLVMEYSSCQLRGHVSPKMKAALMPGMYVVLDVMSQSTMRAMNAGMDSSSRAVFKTLYDDYVRFGKWDHN
ncbi:hypothetical protein FQN49_006248, partial [Arthroderma sp. PD_2]